MKPKPNKPRFQKEIYGDPLVNEFIATAEGERTHSRPYAWCDGKKKYSHITGGLILPTMITPGFLLTVGVEHESNIMHCLDEFEKDNTGGVSGDPYKLIRRAQAIQKEYGPGVIQNWWGNPESLMPLVNEVNIKGNPVLISSPIDDDQKDAFNIFLARLKVALSANYKTFYLNSCNLLKNHIRSFIKDNQAKAVINPAMYITGAIIHTLLMQRPWEQACEVLELLPTTFEETAIYEAEQAEKAVWGEMYGE